MNKINLAYRILKSSIAYDLGQVSVIATGKDELIVRSKDSVNGAFHAVELLQGLSVIGCSYYVAYNKDLNICEAHIF